VTHFYEDILSISIKSKKNRSALLLYKVLYIMRI